METTAGNASLTQDQVEKRRHDGDADDDDSRSARPGPSLINTDCSEGFWVWIRKSALSLKKSVLTLYYASADPRCPFVAKAVAMIALAYALSPIDLVPDFIPVLGILDDLILLPLLIWAAIELIPPEVWDDAVQRSTNEPLWLNPSWGGAAAVVGLYTVLLLWFVRFLAEPSTSIDIGIIVSMVAFYLAFMGYETYQKMKKQERLMDNATDVEMEALEEGTAPLLSNT